MINGLVPQPPEAYWSNVPWWGFLLFLAVLAFIVVVLGPWAIQRSKGALSATTSREQLIGARELAERLRQDRELEEVKKDRDNGWNIARGWVVVAHELWHMAMNALQSHNAMLRLCHRVSEGKLSVSGLRDRLLDIEEKELPEPLPAVEDVVKKKPGESNYA